MSLFYHLKHQELRFSFGQNEKSFLSQYLLQNLQNVMCNDGI